MTNLRYLFTFSPALVYSSLVLPLPTNLVAPRLGDAGAECTPWRCRTSYVSVTDRACPGRSCVRNVTLMRRLHSRPDAKVFPSEKRGLNIVHLLHTTDRSHDNVTNARQEVCRNKNRMGLRAGQGKTLVQHPYHVGRCPGSRKKKYAT
jgi:hypothetical protein